MLRLETLCHLTAAQKAQGMDTLDQAITPETPLFNLSGVRDVFNPNRSSAHNEPVHLQCNID
jgi:hypothetical protein